MPHNKLSYSIMTAANPDFPAVQDKAIEGRLTWGGDAIRYYRGCPEKPDYICIFARNFVFAVPKKLGANIQTWTVQGVVFTVAQKDISIAFLGRQIDDLYLVKASPNGTALGKSHHVGFEYLYSPRAGLLAFGHEVSYALEYNPLTYWLVDEVGFGVVR